MSDESLLRQAQAKATQAERDAFLAAHPDEAQRTRVQAKLADEERASALRLDFELGELTGQYTPSPEPAEASIFAAGQVLAGRYKLLQPLGEGGMGAVWVAEQTEPIRRLVAVKVIRTGLDSGQIVARFEAERQALALMDHPNIAKVFDAGTAAGRPFFVMELVRGVPITRYCDEKRLAPQDRLALFIPVCQALQHAHQKGIIHRDIKPSNVLVAEVDGRPVPKVIDFGVAKATGPQLTDKTLFTEIGTIIGTLEYMSPEQAELTNHDIDTRSDVYSLGVLLYELLTGSTPLDRKRMKQAAFQEVLRVIREEEPPRPSTRLSGSAELASISAVRRMEPKQLGRFVRGDLDWVVMKALEKDRNRRYESASGFAQDLQRYLADEPVLAGPPSAVYRLRKFVRRHRAAVVSGVAFAFLLLAATGISVGLAWWANTERDRAVKAEGEANANATRAQRRLTEIEKSNRFLGIIFGDVDPMRNEPELKPLRERLGERLRLAGHQIDEAAIGDPLTIARLKVILGKSLLGLGFPKDAIPLLKAARARLIFDLGPAHEEAYGSGTTLTLALSDAGHLKESLPLCEELLAQKKQSGGPEDADTIALQVNLGVALHDAGQLAKALPLLEAGHRWRLEKLGPASFETLQAASALARAYIDAGQPERALPLYQESLKGREALYGPDHAHTLRAKHNLASLMLDLDQKSEALPLMKETLAKRQATLGKDHPETLATMINLGDCYLLLGQFAEASQILEECLTLAKKKLGPRHPNTLATMNNLAKASLESGNLERAREMYEETLAGVKAVLGPGHPYARLTARNLAIVYGRQQQPAKGEPLLRECLAAMRTQQPPQPQLVAEALDDLGENLLQQQKADEAVKLLRECLALRQKHPASPLYLAGTQSLLGTALLAQKNYAEAELLLKAGYEGIKSRAAQLQPANRIKRLTEALDPLIRLAEAQGNVADAEKWKAEKAKVGEAK